MKNATGIIAAIIIVNACVWGFAVVMSSVALKGTGEYEKIQNILGGSAAASTVVVGGGLAAIRRKSGKGS